MPSMVSLDHALSTVPITEEALRATGKNLKAIARFDDAQNDEDRVILLNELLHALFSTSLFPGTLSGHRLAAQNVLCGILDQCISSPSTSIVASACEASTIRRLSVLYLDYYDSTISKSMKQVLVTLNKLYVKSFAINGNHVERDIFLKRLLNVLVGGKQHSKAKAAFHAMTHFVNKNLFTPSQLVMLYDNWLGEGSLGSILQDDGFSAEGQLFLNFLDWISSNDIAPTAGLLVSSLLVKGLGLGKTSHSNGAEEVAWWILPLLQSVQTHLDDVPAYRVHIFPALFGTDSDSYRHFLTLLGLEEQLGLPTDKESRQTATARLSPETKAALLFTSLQVGKERGLIEEIDSRTETRMDIQEKVIRIPDIVLGRLLNNESSITRLAGLSLLVTSTLSTRPFTLGTLDCLKQSLPHLLADTDSRSRGEVQSLLKAILDRMRASTFLMARVNDKAPVINISMDFHRRFVVWLHKFLVSELSPTASYQRHISAVHGLLNLLRSGIDPSAPVEVLSRLAKNSSQWPFHLSIIDDSVRRLLSDLLLDPFDDVRQGALNVLKFSGFVKHMPDNGQHPANHSVLYASASESLSGDPETVESLVFDRAKTIMLRTGRVDHADGVARLFDFHSFRSCQQYNGQTRDKQLLPSEGEANSRLAIVEHLTITLETSIEAAEINMANAVSQFPLHGLYTALRYVLVNIFETELTEGEHDILLTMTRRVMRTFERCWICSHPVLCNDAPEGHLPQGLDEEMDITTKDVLSYAWRALKESSLLMRELVTNPSIDLSRLDSPHEEFTVLQSLGTLCFTELAELRHRGAFSTVAQTFAALCQQCGLSKSDKIRALLPEWYTQTLTLVNGKGSIVTRRSAGLPALIIAILSAQPGMFDVAIDQLQCIAVSKATTSQAAAIDLPPVHAMNCLRAIFSSSKLGQQSEKHVVTIMKVAAQRLESDIWAIRNCGLMLFRGLIDRLLGTSEALDDDADGFATSSRLAWENYPGLLDLLVELLKPLEEAVLVNKEVGMKSSAAAERIFPVLDLLRKALPPSSYRKDLRNSMLAACDSPHWHVRDIAAHTYAGTAHLEGVVEEVKAQLDALSTSQNALHGRMLCVRYMSTALLKEVIRAPRAIEVAQQILALIVDRQELVFDLNSCPFTKAAYVEILNIFGCSILQHGSCSLISFNSLALLYKTSSLKTISNLSESHLVFYALNKACSLRTLLELAMELIDMAPSAEQEIAKASRDMVIVLSAADPDVCCSLLADIPTLLKGTPPPVVMAFSRALSTFWTGTDNWKIRSCALAAFYLLADKSSLSPEWLADHNVQAALAALCRKSSLSSDQAPSLLENTLMVWGFAVDAKRRTEGEWSSEFVATVDTWLKMTHSALDEYSEYSLRYAAAQSLRGLRQSLRDGLGMPQKLRISYFIAVYHVLIDDDDDIRDIAAEIVSLSLSSGYAIGFRVVPTVARAMLREYLVRECGSFELVAQNAICRVTGDAMSMHMKGPKQMMEEAMHEHNELFHKERQNLYVDEASEAEAWSSVLQRMAVAGIPEEYSDHLVKWAIEGLDTLISMAEQQFDGALGWTSKVEVFTLGMRIIHASHVVLVWAKQGRLEGSSLRERLSKLQETGRRTALHGLWLQQVETTLEEDSSSL